MKHILLYVAAHFIHYTGYVEIRHGDGNNMTRTVCVEQEGWVRITAKGKYITRTDSTVTVRYPGMTIIYRKKNQ